MKRLPLWKIRTWLLAGLIPSLLAATGWVGWSLYADLHRTILHGFDRKLLAVSTTTASFIRAEDHLQLMERPEIEGIAYDARDDLFYALDIVHHRLLRIRAGNGALEPPAINVERAGLRGLSFASTARRLLALEPLEGRLWLIDSTTGQTSLFFEFGQPITGFTDNGPEGVIYLCADRLYRLEPTTQTVTPISGPGLGNYSSLTYDPKAGVLWGIDPQARRLVSLDPRNGQTSVTFALEQKSLVPRALTFDTQRQTLLGCATSFLTIDRQTGKVDAAHFLPAFGREKSPLYQHYVGPMRVIQEQLNLTYLYSEVVTDRTHLTYGLDGTLGEKHSPLHSADLLPESDADGMRDVMVHGTTYVSDVKDWPPWGLIKTAVAPIRDAAERTIAVVGADVDISLIRAKSRQAMLTAFAIGGLSLLVAAGLSLPLSLRLVRPLQRIQTVAIEAAAGRFDCPLEIQQPAELGDLARIFNQVRTSLDQNLQTARTSTQELLVSRHRRELIRILETHYPLTFAIDESPRMAASVRAAAADGAIRRGPGHLLWIANPSDDPLAALRMRSDLALALRPWIEPSGGPAGGFSSEMPFWLGREIQAVVMATASAQTLELRIRGLLSVWAVRRGRWVEIDLIQQVTESFDAIILCPDGNFLRTAVAPLGGAIEGHRPPSTAAAILAELQRPLAATAPASTLLVFTHVTLICPT